MDRNETSTLTLNVTNSDKYSVKENENKISSSCSKANDSNSVRPAFIPPSLMGRNLNNPMSDLIASGRRIQKPRPGVKVPYRNLTSQIVSQDEIAQEIFERSLRKALGADAADGNDLYFTVKLMPHQSNKVDNSDKKEKIKVEANNNVGESKSKMVSSLIEAKKLSKTVKVCSVESPSNDSIKHADEAPLDNDTLIAILEGNSDTDDAETVDSGYSQIIPCVPNIQIPKRKRLQVNLDPELEKSLALKQLNEIPLRREIRPINATNENTYKKSQSNINEKNNHPKIKPTIERPLRNCKSISVSPDSMSKEVTVVRKVQPIVDGHIKRCTNKRKAKLAADLTLPSHRQETVTKKSKIDASKKIIKHETRKEIVPSVQEKSKVDNRMEVDSKEQMKGNEKTNSKMMREINRLLGDEGAINMLYSVEQKRLSKNKRDTNYLLSTRRRKKDLLLKTKMVKNAVLQMTKSPAHSLPRARRSSPETVTTDKPAIISSSRKESMESVDSLNSIKQTGKCSAEDSRIISRRSSSSAYSSDDESSSEISDLSSFTANKLKIQNVDEFEASEKSQSSKNNSTNENHKQTQRRVLTSKKEKSKEISLKEITVRKYDNLVQIILLSSSTRLKNAWNAEILREFTSVLRDLQKDKDCTIVLVTSTGSSFCQGIDLQALIRSDKRERAKVVSEYVNALTKFTKCLYQFHKLLIAGVHGSAVGLGVTMLPYFDMVYASDKATFYTPYIKLGQIPEAGATLTLPHLLGNAVTSELLFGCRMLTANEALQFGLVTRTLWPDKFHEELLPLVKGIASHSSQSMEATKQLLRNTMNIKMQEQLETEAKLLHKHWCSEECQSRFKNYLDEEIVNHK